ncbi:response regulator [Methylobacillus arboreus]|uniref:response regulator n=1 Tax=Methylobacillus arboreus TaxID=755170 RepID=UPI001E5B2265|nr:response regulator [Methylobacillus arboreus]MCB5190954.1 response regulator [Methylobacillus arboreus]
MNNQDHILVVDDDHEIRELLTDYLRDSGFTVSEAANGREMWRLVNKEQINLIVLDLMLPEEDGLSLCRELRAQQNDTPVIMLTAKGTLIDRIVGLEVGADDYLPKPFDPRELLARIKVILRRTRSITEKTAVDEYAYISFEGWRLDTHARQMFSPDGVIVSLGSSDYMVLRVLLEHPNRPLSREFLIEHVYGKDSHAIDRSIDVCISRLRHHLEVDSRNPAIIRTVRNAGYMLASRVTHEK